MLTHRSVPLWVLGTFCLNACLALGAQPAPFKPIKVNGEEIPGAVMQKVYDRSLAQLPKDKPLPEVYYERLHEAAIQEIVQQTVLRQYVARNKIVAPPEAVNEEIASIRQQVESSEVKTLDAYLRMRGQTLKEFTDELSNATALIQSCIGSLDLTKLKEQFRRDLEAEKFPLRRASHILFMHAASRTTNQPRRSPAEARRLAEKTLEKVRRGDDFARLAQELSDCSSKERGGDLDWFVPGQMVKPFSTAAYGLGKVGDSSGIVETDFGFHIIKLTGLRTEEEAWKVYTRASAELKAQEILQQLQREVKVSE